MTSFLSVALGLAVALARLLVLAPAGGDDAGAKAGVGAMAGAGTGTGWVPERLDLALALWPERREIAIEATLALRLEAETSLGPTITINASHPNMRFEEVAAPDGATVEIEPGTGARAHVRWAEPRRQGARVELSIKYRNAADKSFQFQVNDRIALASWTESWYPRPEPGAGLETRVKRAPGTTTFELPLGWHAVANGALTEQWDDGERSFETYVADAMVARSFAAGPFEVSHEQAGERTIGVFLLSSSKDGAARRASVLARALTAMEARFGPYPYRTYAIVEVPDALVEWAASSEQGFVMANTSAFASEIGSLPLFAHEMAHGWWGNLVTATGPGSILLGETLAQYGAVTAIEAIEGEAAATEFLRFSREGYSPDQCARGYFGIVRRKQDVPLSQLTNGPMDHTLSDSKGMWFQHMLRRRVGDDMFFATLRQIVQDFGERPLDLPEFRRRFARAAPADAGLEKFLAQWLDRKGAPVLEASSRDTESDGHPMVEVEVRQRTEPYELALELAVESDRGTRTHQVMIAERVATFTLPREGSTRAVRLDPNHRLLLWQPEYGPRPED